MDAVGRREEGRREEGRRANTSSIIMTIRICCTIFSGSDLFLIQLNYSKFLFNKCSKTFQCFRETGKYFSWWQVRPVPLKASHPLPDPLTWVLIQGWLLPAFPQNHSLLFENIWHFKITSFTKVCLGNVGKPCRPVNSQQFAGLVVVVDFQ